MINLPVFFSSGQYFSRADIFQQHSFTNLHHLLNSLPDGHESTLPWKQGQNAGCLVLRLECLNLWHANDSLVYQLSDPVRLDEQSFLQPSPRSSNWSILYPWGNLSAILYPWGNFHLYFIHGGNLSAGCRSTPGKVFFSAEPFLLCDSVQFSFQLTATGAVCESGPKLRNPCGFLSYPLKPQLWMSGIPVLQTLHKSSSCYWLW